MARSALFSCSSQASRSLIGALLTTFWSKRRENSSGRFLKLGPLVDRAYFFFPPATEGEKRSLRAPYRNMTKPHRNVPHRRGSPEAIDAFFFTVRLVLPRHQDREKYGGLVTGFHANAHQERHKLHLSVQAARAREQLVVEVEFDCTYA